MLHLTNLHLLHSYHTISHSCVQTVVFLGNVYFPAPPHLYPSPGQSPNSLHPSRPSSNDTSFKKLSFIIPGIYKLSKVLNLHLIFIVFIFLNLINICKPFMCHSLFRYVYLYTCFIYPLYYQLFDIGFYI